MTKFVLDSGMKYQPLVQGNDDDDVGSGNEPPGIQGSNSQ